MENKLLFLVSFAAVVMTANTAHNAGDHGEMADILNALQKEIALLKEEHEQAVAALQEQLGETQKDVNQVKETNRQVIEENAVLKHRLDVLRDNVNVESLFLATISVENLQISDDEPIIWDSAPINPGGHFNTILGAYIAPSHGYYQFTVVKRSNLENANFWLLVDENRVFYTKLVVTATTNPTSSATINIELNAGQIVRVENDVSSLIRGTDSDGVISSRFTGFLLYAL